MASRLLELSSVIALAGQTATSDDRRGLVTGIAEFVLALSREANGKTKVIYVNVPVRSNALTSTS